ncbi:MAG: efflux RND transporter periplasmic adaptor subunit [Bacteroidales bacterium]|nr:efflux RND transporter periplasmic adaptor subunit [Bacteroidales bacterium]
MAVAIVMSMSGCHSTHDRPESDVEHEEHESPDIIHFSEAQFQKAGMATEAVLYGSFDCSIRCVAQLVPVKSGERALTAGVGGVINFAVAELAEGMSVKAGQPLFFIETGKLADSDGNMALRLQEAETNYTRLKAEYERKRELALAQVASAKELQQAEADFNKADALVRLMRENFANGRQTVSSPISGFIRQMAVKSGEYVPAGYTLMTVAQDDNLLVEARVPQKYRPMLANIKSADLRLAGDDRLIPLSDLDGKLLSVNKSLEAGHSLLLVNFRISNKMDLLAGSFIEVFINIDSGDTTLSVPTDALVEEFGNYFVFVHHGDDDFEKRLVMTGRTNARRTEITGGLVAGETIVSKRAILLKLAQSGTPVESGHHH